MDDRLISVEGPIKEHEAEEEESFILVDDAHRPSLFNHPCKQKYETN
jgi:hypothetical protein